MNALKTTALSLLITFISLLNASEVKGQRPYLDSLSRELKVATTDSARATLLSELMYGYLNTQPAKSIDYGLQLLDITPEAEQEAFRRNIYAILGEASFYLEQYAQAESFFFDQLKSARQLGDSSEIASALTNLGIIKRHNGKYPKALDYYQKALAIKQQAGDSSGISSVYNNIGVLYEALNLPSKAMEYYKQSLIIEKHHANAEGIATSWLNIGALFPALGKPDSAKFYLMRCINLSDSLGFSIIEEMAHESLAKHYKQTHTYALALHHYQEMMALQKQRINLNNSQHVAELTQTFRFNEQEEIITKLNKANQYKTLVNYLALAIIIITGILSLLLWRENRKRKQNNDILQRRNKEIGQQNEEIESQRDEIIKTRDQLIHQNTLLEKQHDLLTKQKKDLTDSLEYARHIQNALMPEATKMKSLLNNGFFLFLPRDIVSGDFYWGTEINGTQLLICADATGHGVPGAFLSIIGINFLNEVIHTQGITDPATILWEMRKRMINLLVYSNKYEEAKDSIDMGVLLIDRPVQKVTYAGAYHHLFYIHEGMLQVIKGDKMCVGLSVKEMLPFTNHTLEVSPGDSLYLFSDGYPDQFGGKRRKKLRIGNFKELLLSCNEYSMDEQKKMLFDYFVKWKEGLPQVDDVLLIGLRM
ncbi:MAG: tetratricopeptide repeat protein [Bacteroidota bacterium]